MLSKRLAFAIGYVPAGLLAWWLLDGAVSWSVLLLVVAAATWQALNRKD